MRSAARRTFAAMLLLAAAACGWLLIDGGRYLQHEDALQRSDAIFVLAGMRTERWLEAYDLFKDGYAPTILLSPGRTEPGERILKARGVHFPSEAELQRDALVQLGVPAAAVIASEGFVDNTAQEADFLRTTAQARGWRRVIVVTSKFHTRRSGFAFRRALSGTGIEIVMRASRYDPSDPARWWRTRADFRFGIYEWEKLLAYRLGAGG
jgi:uncharacterized SAM-binding protein YcdF (DUF218 family)